ncbi:UNVERIFIED_CONTAM: hypothetical protein FKN15_069901 [Acipenser sinensis]
MPAQETWDPAVPCKRGRAAPVPCKRGRAAPVPCKRGRLHAAPTSITRRLHAAPTFIARGLHAAPTSTTGSTVAGALERGAAGHEGGGGLETTNPSSSFAAGVLVAGAPQEGATGYEERGRGQETSIPRSNFAAGVDQHAVSRATTGRGAESIASHGPSEASLPSPRLCPGMLDF